MAKTLISAALIGTTIAFTSAALTFAGGHSPVEKRQAAMKTVGGSSKIIGDMLKSGDIDAAKANEALVAMQSAVADFGDDFPEGSEAAESEAGPAIWSDRDGFNTVLAAFQDDIDAAVAAEPQDAAALGAAFGAVGENCGVCHKSYRVKK